MFLYVIKNWGNIGWDFFFILFFFLVIKSQSWKNRSYLMVRFFFLNTREMIVRTVFDSLLHYFVIQQFLRKLIPSLESSGRWKMFSFIERVKLWLSWVPWGHNKIYFYFRLKNSAVDKWLRSHLDSSLAHYFCSLAFLFSYALRHFV